MVRIRQKHLCIEVHVLPQRHLNVCRVPLEIQGAFWADLLVWGLANRKLSEREAKTLEICSNYPKKIPTDFQCKQAVSVLERLKHDGFVEAQA